MNRRTMFKSLFASVAAVAGVRAIPKTASPLEAAIAWIKHDPKSNVRFVFNDKSLDVPHCIVTLRHGRTYKSKNDWKPFS